MGNDLAKAAAQAGQALQAGARTHKRSQEAHRRAAQKNKKALAFLEAACKDLGIELELEDTDQGGQSHGRGS